MDNTVTTLNKDWGSHFGVDLQDRQHVSSAPNASDSGFAYAFLHEHEMGEDATNSASMASSQSTDEFLHTGGSLLQHLLPPISASDSKLEQKLDDSEKMPDGWLLQDSSVSDPSHDHSASVLLHSHHDTDPLRLVHHHHHQQQQHQQHPLQHHHQQQHHQQHQHHGHVRDVDGPGQTHYSQHTRQMRALNDYAMSPTEYRTAMEPATGSKRPREQGAQMPQKRRMSHNATEQRRRNKIKERIEELRATVPICDSERKADILKKSVDYIKFLQQQYSDLIIKAKKLQEEYYNIGGKQDFLSPHGNHTQQQQQHQQQHHHLQHQQQHHHQHQHHSYHTAPSPSSSASSSSSSSSPSHLNHMGNSLSNGSILIANGSSMAHAYSLPQIQSIHYSSSPPPSSVSIPASPPLIHLQHQQQHHLHQQQQQQVLLSHVLPQHATTNGNGNMLSYSPMSSIIPSKDDKKLSPDSPSESSPDTP